MTSLDELLALLPDNTTGEISAADMRAVVTGLWDQAAADGAALAALVEDNEARIDALENRAGDGVTVAGRWQYNNQAGAVPGGMQVTADSGELQLAAWLRFAKVNQNNNDATQVLLHTTRLYAQQQSDASNWITYTVAGAAVDAGSYVQVPVEVTDSGGAAVSAGWQAVTFVFTVAATP